MSEIKRSWGVSFFASAFMGSAAVSILFWASPLYLCVTHPEHLQLAGKYLFENPAAETGYMLYDNTLLFAYFFIAIGLYRLKPWAYKLLVFLLLVGAVERLGSSVKAGVGQDFLVSSQAAVQFVGNVLLLLFFRRKKIRIQFEDDSTSQPLMPQNITTVPIAAGAGDFKASEMIRESKREEGETSGELERLAGSEKMLLWVIILAGIFFSLKQKMTIVNSGLFGGLWGLESYVICFYIFRAKKVKAIAGGAVSIGISLGLSTFVNIPGENIWMEYGLNALSALLGGLVSGLLTQRNGWFHGSSAGFVWAVFYFAKGFYEKYGWSPSFERMDLLEVLNMSLIIMVIGLLGGCLGGLLSSLRPGRAYAS